MKQLKVTCTYKNNGHIQDIENSFLILKQKNDCFTIFDLHSPSKVRVIPNINDEYKGFEDLNIEILDKPEEEFRERVLRDSAIYCENVISEMDKIEKIIEKIDD